LTDEYCEEAVMFQKFNKYLLVCLLLLTLVVVQTNISADAASTIISPTDIQKSNILVHDYQAFYESDSSLKYKTEAISGTQIWISLLCNFPDHPDNDFLKLPSYFDEQYSSSFPGLDHYWQEVSYNNFSIAGSSAVDEWREMPHPWDYYLTPEGDPEEQSLTVDCVDLFDSDIDFSNYAGINLMFGASFRSRGNIFQLSRDGVGSIRTTWIAFPHNTSTVVHEMGHTWGLNHSWVYDWSTGNLAANSEYENKWDIMSEMDNTYFTDDTFGPIP